MIKIARITLSSDGTRNSLLKIKSPSISHVDTRLPSRPTLIRALRLVAALTANYLTFFSLQIKRSGRVSLADRARWMHHSCRRVARALHLPLHVTGSIPTSGLIVSNHLSYLDILAFASATPCIFVSKQDVLSWPIFGALARFGGTIFVNRNRRTAVDSASQSIAAALHTGLPVVLFPEGTSTSGSHVLPFHASLLEPAIRAAAPVTAAAIGYRSSTHPESAFCYYGDIRFAQHLPSILRIPHARMHLHFSAASQPFANRKQAAQALHQQTVSLRAAIHASQPAVIA